MVLAIGDTELTRIGLGTNRLANTPENQEFVRAAIEAGVDFVDTAHLYTGGGARKRSAPLSEGHTKGLWSRRRAAFATDVPMRCDRVEESLARLRTDRVDLYYLHRVDADVEIGTSLEAIKEYRDAGQIAEVGVSAVSVEQIERARQVLPIAAVQNHFNLTERTSEDVIDYCTEQAILFVALLPTREQAGPRASRRSPSGTGRHRRRSRSRGC